jgi:transcriptional regulator
MGAINYLLSVDARTRWYGAAKFWQEQFCNRFRYRWYLPVATAQERLTQMTDTKLDLLQGTLEVMVLQTLSVMGRMHGYGVARRIEQVSGHEVLLNQGTIYASLVRLQQRGWIDAEWGVSDNNRKAKYYSITRAGRKQLAQDMVYWQRLAAVMERVFAIANEEKAHA